MNVNTVLEKNVEYIVEKEVQVPVEKVVEVEVGVSVEKPVFNEVTMQEDLVVETLNEETTVVQMPEEVVEHDDEELAREILVKKREIETQQTENKQLRSRFDFV